VSAPIALAVLGDPLAYTQSPVLHRAGLESLGRIGTSAALRTPLESLGERLRELRSRGFLGANLTTPLKEAALAHVDRISEAARQARSVNTVGFGSDGVWGDTTDGPGFVDLLGTWGRDPARERALLLGGGGAARSLALALISAGAPRVTAWVRRPSLAGAAWAEIEGAQVLLWGEAPERMARGPVTVVVNTTPLEDPIPVTALPLRSVVVDLRYGPGITTWVREARARGFEAYDGLGLLVFQARRSLALWCGRPVAVDPLAQAVGWPR
jgi:shikimate dehydrogenase